MQGSASTGQESIEEPLEALGIVARSKMGFWSVKPGQVLVMIRWKQKMFGVGSLVKMQQVKCCGGNDAYIPIFKKKSFKM